MRYIKTPPPIFIDATVADPEKPGQAKLVQRAYSFFHFVTEFVFTEKQFRDEWARHYITLAAEIRHDALIGDVVKLADEDWEKLKHCAKSATLPPHVGTTLMPFIHAITLASSVSDSATVEATAPS